MKRVFLLLGIFSSLLATTATAQIDVQDNQTALALAQTLTGQGVVVLNPTMNCVGIANGKFALTAGTTTLNIDSGIVLTSGRAKTLGAQQGVNGPNTGSGPTQDNGAPGDPDLNTVNPGFLSADRCVLEFDFIPAGDTVKFDYAFGSTEYQSFSCSSYNDIFGFFISGPGITGNHNIALIPGTNIPICVNSTTGVSNGGQCTSMGPGSPFSQYYIANAGGATITYYGFTQIFTAIANVIPCDTFHLKLAIADGSSGGTDRILDSGVFLKAGSLNSTGIKLTPETTSGANTSVSHCIRGCKSGHVDFHRPTARPTPLTIKYLIQGTAVNGVDYQTITDSVTIPANQNDAQVEIKPLLVQYASGPKFVTLYALSPYQCGSSAMPTISDSATVWIYDSLYVNIPTTPTITCPRTEVPITAEIDTSLRYTWSPMALIPDPLPLGLTIHPKPVVPTTYRITVFQPGAPVTCPTVSRAFFANVEAIPQLVLPSLDTTVCLSDSINIPVYALPLGPNYTYNWSPAAYLRDNHSPSNMLFAPVGDYKYVITATTPIAHCSNKDSFLLHIVPPFTFQSVTPKDTTIKYGDSIKLSSRSEAIYWVWDPITYLSDPLAREPLAKPLQDMVYTLVGINQYGCSDSATIKIKVKYDPNTGMPNAFSPNGDGLNDEFKIGNIRFEKMTEFKVFNRWGQCMYNGTDPARGWDGTFKGQQAALDTYFYLVKLTLPGGIQKEYKGDVVLLR